jgi:hypothetical protein
VKVSPTEIKEMVEEAHRDRNLTCCHCLHIRFGS